MRRFAISFVILATLIFPIFNLKASDWPCRNGIYTGLFASPNYVRDIKKRDPLTGIEYHLKSNVGWFGAGSAGFSYNDRFRFEVEGGFRVTAFRQLIHNHDHHHEQGHFQVASFLGNVYIDFSRITCMCLKPYLGGGAGYASSRVHVHKRKDLYKGNKSGFAWQGIAGFSYPLTRFYDLVCEYRFFRAHLPKTHIWNDNTHNFGLGIRYYF